MTSLYNSPRARTQALLAALGDDLPQLSIVRAYHFTKVFQATECLPLPLRWAKAMRAVLEHLPAVIQENELIVGRAGPIGRYGLFYPELEGAYFAKADALRETERDAPYHLSAADLHCLHTEIVPYWRGRTFREGLAAALPPRLKQLLYKDGNIYEPSCIIHESATVRHSLQWVLDYGKVLREGFVGIHARAQAALQHLHVNDKAHPVDRAPFYLAVMEVCEAIRDFAERHAQQAACMARTETDPQRAQELRTIAAICHRVPWQPARSFHEAVQAQWFTQLVSRIEQMHGGIISNGRIDQYFYEFYHEDILSGRLTDAQALEILDCLWCNIAQFKRLPLSAVGFTIYEGNAHWEHTTLGGQLPDGGDATNELTYLILQSWKEFPLDYPDLGIRLHANTPAYFLDKLVDALPAKNGGFPKFLNDEEIIPHLVQTGVTPEEARDYSGSGCSEARCINRHTYLGGTTWFNLSAALEMTLDQGRCHAAGDLPAGVITPPIEAMTSFADIRNAFNTQLASIITHVFTQQYLADSLRTRFIAAPLLSALHDLCMEEGRDINEGRFAREVSLGGQIGPIGFATVVDSLAAIKWLVFDQKKCTLAALVQALKTNFEGAERLRALCLSAPKYGDGILWVDMLARDIENRMVQACCKHQNYYGGHPQVFHVPVTCHKAMGRFTGATPNGRRAGDILSEGVSPSRGINSGGILAVLQSVMQGKSRDTRALAARYLTLHLAPTILQGPRHSLVLKALLRLWLRQKHWHLQLHLVDNDMLLEAENMPDTYRCWNERLPGHSARFTRLTPQQRRLLLDGGADGTAS